MGWFDRNSHKSETGEFMGLVLGEDQLQTPVGAMPLEEIMRAEFVRTIVPGGPGPEETSVPAVIGGAVVGGALFGTAGAIVGGVAGSTVKEEGPEELQTTAVQVVFETRETEFAMAVPRDKEYAAVEFVDTVRRAVKHHSV